MRLLTASLAAAPLLLAIAGCTAQGSSTVIQKQGSTSGAPTFPGDADGGDTAATDYAALFGPPASTDATPDSLLGLWAGTSDVFETDTRLQFTGSSIVIAQKCPDARGIKVVARVTASAIKTLESKSYVPPSTSSGSGSGSGGTSGCRLSVVPFEIPRCTGATAADANLEASSLTNGCFYLEGTSLSFFKSDTLIGRATLTKLSD